MSAAISLACLQAFPEPLFGVTPGGRIRAANSAAAAALHLSSGTDPEVTLSELCALPLRDIERTLNLCLSTGDPVPLRLDFFPTGGSKVSVRCEGWRCVLDGEVIALIRLRGDDGVASRFGELTRLVDELNLECAARRKSESRLKTALTQLHDINGIRDHMLAQVSHDLRTPLNAILGMTEFMSSEPYGPLGERYSEYIRDIRFSGQALLQLVDQVLHLAWDDRERLESGSDALADLSECIENCRKVVEPVARMRGLEIMIPADISLPRLRADQMLVKQILMNLLGNAAKYTGVGGHIEVKIGWESDKSLAIHVEDDGPGIPEEKLAAINSGQMARSAYVTDETKVGFGLVLSRRTANAIGGRLDIRSAVGRGTIASLVLPSHLLETGQAVLH